MPHAFLKEIYDIRHLANTLRRKFRVTAVIPGANVPIGEVVSGLVKALDSDIDMALVKFVDRRTGINCKPLKQVIKEHMA